MLMLCIMQPTNNCVYFTAQVLQMAVYGENAVFALGYCAAPQLVTGTNHKVDSPLCLQLPCSTRFMLIM